MLRRLQWLGAMSLALIAACGGGSPPVELATARVNLARSHSEKRVVYTNSRLKLIKSISHLPGAELLVVGSEVCRVLQTGIEQACTPLPVQFLDVDILSDGSELHLVGGGGWGKPSVAVVDSSGQLRWRFDGGYGLMAPPVVVDSKSERLVIVGDRSFKVANGDQLSPALCHCGAIASADFDGDGRRDVLQRHGDDFVVINGEGVQLARARLPPGDWSSPAIADRANPFIVSSSSDRLLVFDRRLQPVRNLPLPSASPELQPIAAAFVSSEPDAAFAVLFSGRGGWHRTLLYVYSSDGRLLYQETLQGDFASIVSSTSRGALAFFLGGRGDVLAYTFADGV